MDYSVLVVDDDEDDFALLSAYMQQCQQNVILTYAWSGEEAIKKLTNGVQPNLIMIDAQMPLMSGYELLVWLMNAEAFRNIPVVIWTGAISTSEINRYYGAGANSLMLKQDTFQDVETFCKHWFKLVQLPESLLN